MDRRGVIAVYSCTVRYCASIQNKTGKVFEDAEIKLVAGDVHKEAPDQRGRFAESVAMSAPQSAPKVESEPGFEKKDARTIEFSLDLAPGAAETIRYTAEYTW